MQSEMEHKSHPMRVRELKLSIPDGENPRQQSHPMRVRELKPIESGRGLYVTNVAPHAGA